MAATTSKLKVPEEQIRAFCKKWKISELSLFGSVLRDDFMPSSDVDLLVTFSPEAKYSLFDMVEMEDELCEILGRKVDLVEKNAVDASPNYIRRREILSSFQVLYAA